MKSAAICLFLLLPAGPLLAQDKPETPAGRKTMVFQPGAKTPDGAAAEPAPSVTTRQEVDTKVPQDAPGKLVADFFAQLAMGKIDEAYNTLTSGSRIVEKPEDLRILKAKTKEAIEVFGTIVGYELVEAKPIGSRLIRRTYLSLGSDFPLRWRFYFYNANSRWRLIDMRVDDKLAGMFDEAPEPGPDEAKRPLAP